MFNRFRKLVLFLVGVSIPIQGLALNVVGVHATPFKILTAFLLVLAGLQFALRMGRRPRDSKNLWVVGFALSYVVGVVGSIVAGLPAGAVIRTGTTMTALLSFYFLLGYVIQSRDDLMLLLWALVLGGVVTVFPAAAGLEGSGGAEEGGRYAGLSGQENLLGADMNVCFAISAGLFFMNRSTLRKSFLLGSAGLSLVGVALSLSRSAFLGTGSMWMWWLYRSGRRGGLQYAAVAVMVGIVGLVAMPEAVVNRFYTMVDPAKRAADRSIQGRFALNEWALRAFVTHPIAGVGSHRFPTWLHEQPSEEARRLPWHTVHNSYLGIAADQGLFGLAPFLAMLVLSWRDYSRCWRASRVRRSLRDPALQELGALALFLQLALLSGIVGGFFHQAHRSKTLWMVMALSPVMLGLVRARLTELFGTQQADASSEALFPEPAGALPRPHPS
jgi:O-antigen ligase